MDSKTRGRNNVATAALGQEGPLVERDLTGQGGLTQFEFRTIVDALGAPVIVVDSRTRIYHANQEFERISGFRLCEMEGWKRWVDFICPEDRKPVEARHRAASLNRGRWAKRYNCRFIDGEGSVRAISVTLSLLPRRDLPIVTFHEISPHEKGGDDSKDGEGSGKRGQAAAGLLETNRMEILSMLVSGVIHEINNPNGIIMFNTSLLSDMWRDVLLFAGDPAEGARELRPGGFPWEEGKHAVTRLLRGISEGSERIGRIVADLKGLAPREDDGVRRPVNMNSVVQYALRILQGRIRRYTADLQVCLAHDLPDTEGKGRQLEQAFINLILHVFPTLPAGGGGVEISTSFEGEGSEGSVVVSIRGGGIGSRREAPGVSSAGLSVARSIIAEHGGTLSFDAEQGSTVRVVLPAVPERGR